ncbi:MAG: hypothetical protein SFU99_06820 [Saprospiraceae bacterium]|nr:hypothetical protein [Saprospiraceae bacterium]
MKNNLPHLKVVLLLCTLLMVSSCLVIKVQRHPSPPPRVYKRVPSGHQKHRHDDWGERHHPRGKHKKHGHYKHRRD